MPVELPNKATHLSDQERAFIRVNWGEMSPPEIRHHINKSRLRKISTNKVKCVAWEMGVFKTDCRHYHHKEFRISEDKLTCKDREFIKKQCRSGKPLGLILEAVNAPKDVKITMDELQDHINTHVIPVNPKANKKIVFDAEEVNFLTENAEKLSCRQLANAINASRAIAITGQSVRTHLVKMGLR